MSTNNAVNTSLSGQTGSGPFVGATSPTITTPVIAQINNSNGLPVTLFTGVASAVNYLDFVNGATGNAAQMLALGSDSNVELILSSKGTSHVSIYGASGGTQPVEFISGTNYQHGTFFNFSNTAATRTVTFPDADGTVTFSSLTLPTTTASQHIRTGPTNNVLVATNACHWENIQVFDVSGTFNVPSDVDLVYVIAVGSGGSGGGGSSGTIGSGGGSGSTASGLVSVTPGGTVTVTIGGASTGGTTGNPGANGTDSSFGASVIGKAGSAGLAGGSVGGGAGGVAGTGTIITIGNSGAGGASIATNLGAGGGGGSPMFGGNGAVTTGAGGNGGTNTGGGGAGGRNANSGGNGGSGIVIVYY